MSPISSKNGWLIVRNGGTKNARVPLLFDTERDGDDVDEPCLCKNGDNCILCRLQKRVKATESNNRRLEREREASVTKYNAIIDEWNRMTAYERTNGIEPMNDDDEWIIRAQEAEATIEEHLETIANLEHKVFNLVSTIKHLRTQPASKIAQDATGHNQHTIEVKRGGKTGGIADPRAFHKTARKLLQEIDDEEDIKPIFRHHSSHEFSKGKPETKIVRRTHPTQKKVGNKHRYETDEEDDDDDDDDDSDFEPPTKRRHSSRSRAHSLARDICKPRSHGRSTNNSQSGFLDNTYLGVPPGGTQSSLLGLGSGRASNSSRAQLMAGPSMSTGTTRIAVTHSTQTSQSNVIGRRKAERWSNLELQALISLVRAHRQQRPGPDGKEPLILHDMKLFELMSLQLQQQYGISRSVGACKNEWNRRGRELSGIDNRKIANPWQMSTSIQ